MHVRVVGSEDYEATSLTLHAVNIQKERMWFINGYVAMSDVLLTFLIHCNPELKLVFFFL